MIKHLREHMAVYTLLITLIGVVISICTWQFPVTSKSNGNSNSQKVDTLIIIRQDTFKDKPAARSRTSSKLPKTSPNTYNNSNIVEVNGTNNTTIINQENSNEK